MLSGTLDHMVNRCKVGHIRPKVVLPDEITEPEDQDSNARELNDIWQIRIESLDQLWKHGCQRQGAQALDESGGSCTCQCRAFPEGTPILNVKVSLRAMQVSRVLSLPRDVEKFQVTQCSPMDHGDCQTAGEPALDPSWQRI